MAISCPAWRQVFGRVSVPPRNTPPEIVEKLNREVNTALADPKVKARFGDLGATAFPGSPADFGRFIGAEIEKWSKVVRAANIKPD